MDLPQSDDAFVKPIFRGKAIVAEKHNMGQTNA